MPIPVKLSKSFFKHGFNNLNLPIKNSIVLYYNVTLIS